MKSFEETLEYKIGTYGEEIVKKHLLSRGFVMDVDFNKYVGGHLFESKLNFRTKKLNIEVKTKASRNKYSDTGIDLYNHKKLLSIKEKVFIFFVDFGESKNPNNTEFNMMIYGNYFSVLNQENGRYPWTQETKIYDENQKQYKTIVYYPLNSMMMLWKITNEEYGEYQKIKQGE